MKKNNAKPLLAGLALGAGLGVLFAPKKGSETRKDLKDKMDELLDKVKNMDKVEVKENIEKRIAELKSDLEDLDKEKALKIAKEKAKKIQDKAEELVEYAIEKGTPVLEKTAKEAKEKTIEILNATIKKLENSEKEPVKKWTKTTTKK